MLNPFPRFRGFPSLILYSALGQIVAMAGQDRGPAVQEVLSRRVFLQGTAISLSADGRYVAYTVQDLSQRALPQKDKTSLCPGCEVSITDLKSHSTKLLSNGENGSWGPVWSPSGHQLAYYAQFIGRQRLCIWQVASETSRCIADVTLTAASYVNTPQWTPGEDRILAQSLSGREYIPNGANLAGKSDEDRSTPVIYQNPDTFSAESVPKEPLLSTLELVSTATGHIERLTAVRNPVWFSLSPNGAYLAYTVKLPRQSSNSYQDLFNLVILDMGSRQLRTIVHAVKSLGGSSFSWSPDSTLLAYTTYDVSRYPHFRGDCFVATVASGHVDKVTSGTHPSFANEYLTPSWSGDSRLIYLLPSLDISTKNNGSQKGDTSIWVANASTRQVKRLFYIPGRRIVAIVSARANGRISRADDKGLLCVLTIDQRTKRIGCFAIEISTGSYTKLFEADKAYSIFAQALGERAADENTVLFVAEEVSKTPNLFAVTSREHKLEQLTNLNPQLDRDSYATTSLIEWSSLDGQTLRGAVLLPRNYQRGRRYPVIVYQYPGSNFSDLLNCYGFGRDVINMLPFAAEGYAIFLPDSTAGLHTPMVDIAKSVLPGVNKLVELGIADPDRLGVMGHSYGGYGVLSLIVQSARFKAAVALAPANVDRILQYSNLWPDGSSIFVSIDEGQLGGTPWTARERYIENSPIFYLDRIKTPLMIIQGARDTGVPDRETDMMFVGLRRLGKEVEYVKYPNEGHVITGYANQLDYMKRILAWFDRYLKSP